MAFRREKFVPRGGPSGGDGGRGDGQKATVAISCATLAELRERDGKNLTDQQLADIAALHLRRTLEHGYEATEAELFLSGEEFRALGRELGYL